MFVNILATAMEDADYSSKYSEGSLVWAKVSGYPW